MFKIRIFVAALILLSLGGGVPPLPLPLPQAQEQDTEQSQQPSVVEPVAILLTQEEIQFLLEDDRWIVSTVWENRMHEPLWSRAFAVYVQVTETVEEGNHAFLGAERWDTAEHARQAYRTRLQNPKITGEWYPGEDSPIRCAPFEDYWAKGLVCMHFPEGEYNLWAFSYKAGTGILWTLVEAAHNKLISLLSSPSPFGS